MEKWVPRSRPSAVRGGRLDDRGRDSAFGQARAVRQTYMTGQRQVEPRLTTFVACRPGARVRQGGSDPSRGTCEQRPDVVRTPAWRKGPWLAVNGLRNSLSLRGAVGAVVHSDKGQLIPLARLRAARRSCAGRCEGQIVRGQRCDGVVPSLPQKYVLTAGAREELQPANLICITRSSHPRRRQDALGRRIQDRALGPPGRSRGLTPSTRSGRQSPGSARRTTISSRQALPRAAQRRGSLGSTRRVRRDHRCRARLTRSRLLAPDRLGPYDMAVLGFGRSRRG
jgi:hypothetical protein